METEKMLSVGIDIGTSTLQIIFSHLTVQNFSSFSAVSDYRIADKRVVYKSPIYFTPMKSPTLLQMDSIKEILEQEFLKSGCPRDNIATGAIIITGEAANKENADLAAAQLAEFAGDFVVAVAGPDLESVLAGHGSGAAKLSREQKKRIANLDIGGGTTNTSVFRDGVLEDCYGVHVGGRLIRLSEAGEILYCSQKIKCLAEESHLEFSEGKKPSMEELRIICQRMAGALVKILNNEDLTCGEKKLQIYHGSKPCKIDAVSVSGGIGELYQCDEPGDLAEVCRYGDIGPLLAWELRKSFEENKLSYVECEEKLRATVIGAGMHSMKLSGSTISVEKELLPLKNIPVAALKLDPEHISSLTECMREKAALHSGPIAFCLRELGRPDYQQIKQIAGAIWEYYEETAHPILLVMREDLAKVLGQSIGIRSRHTRAMLCIDGLSAEDGEYIDFCRTVGDSLMVTVKTLIFRN